MHRRQWSSCLREISWPFSLKVNVAEFWFMVVSRLYAEPRTQHAQPPTLDKHRQGVHLNIFSDIGKVDFTSLSSITFYFKISVEHRVPIDINHHWSFSSISSYKLASSTVLGLRGFVNRVCIFKLLSSASPRCAQVPKEARNASQTSCRALPCCNASLHVFERCASGYGVH